jgi:hypothetical protein
MGKHFIVFKNLINKIAVSKFTYYKQGDKNTPQNKIYN